MGRGEAETPWLPPASRQEAHRDVCLPSLITCGVSSAVPVQMGLTVSQWECAQWRLGVEMAQATPGSELSRGLIPDS